jgi:hypothetical protein
MNYMSISNITIATTSFGIAIIGSINIASAGTNLCQIEAVPESVIKRTIHHSDFEEILSKMTLVCPTAALALTEAATAAGEGVDEWSISLPF